MPHNNLKNGILIKKLKITHVNNASSLNEELPSFRSLYCSIRTSLQQLCLP